MFQSRKRFRHCWSTSPCCNYAFLYKFQSRKRFRHCWSHAAALGNCTQPVSIAKAIPSLLEHEIGVPQVKPAIVSIAKAIPSLLEPGTACESRRRKRGFQSRKRFRHCWSAHSNVLSNANSNVSIAKAIPSLLEPALSQRYAFNTVVSIAKAIPSLLEPCGQ